MGRAGSFDEGDLAHKRDIQRGALVQEAWANGNGVRSAVVRTWAVVADRRIPCGISYLPNAKDSVPIDDGIT